MIDPNSGKRETGTADAAPGPAAGSSVIRGVRWALWLNIVSLPMSFVTNLIFGRTSPETLGSYTAIQVFVGAFQTFFVFGGNAVFARLVPPLPRARRTPFLVSYASLVLAVFSVVWLGASVFVPEAFRPTLLRFGTSNASLAYGVAFSVVVWAFASHFLFAVGQAPRAALALKLVVLGYFVFAVNTLTPVAAGSLKTPAATLWGVTAGVYGIAAAVAVVFIVLVPGDAATLRVGWFLPKGFWSVVSYTHLGTLVEFVNTSLSPSIVLLWLDLGSLGRLSAALRWVTLVILLPSILVSVVAPGLAKLESSGLRDEALRQARAAVRASEIAVAPAVFALVLFAPQFMAAFGPDYRSDAPLLRIAAVSALAGPTVSLGAGLAVAFGALRGYLGVSGVYVAASLALNLILVPIFGIKGAAAATTLSAVTQAIAVTFVVKSLGFRPPRSTRASWIFGVGAAILSWVFEPSLLAAGGLWVAVTAGFAWTAAVSRSELTVLVERVLGRRS